MTVVRGIEIDDYVFKPNDIKRAIRANAPVEEKLHVIAVISNPCKFARRFILMQEFIERFEKEEMDCVLYVVELAYKTVRHYVTDPTNPRHLQLRCEQPLWHKENMINLAVQRLLPPNWRAFAWIDADLEFESTTWAKDTLRILNGECDVVQLFSHCVDMDPQENALQVFNSAGFQYSKRLSYNHVGVRNNYWHPGYAWATTRQAYEYMGGLFDKGIVGGGDNIMLLSILGNGHKALHADFTPGYQAMVAEYQEKVKDFRLGYVPGVIRHHFHGSKINRQYLERWDVLLNHAFDPWVHLAYDAEGVLVTTDAVGPAFKADILRFFSQRDEDEGLGKDGKYPPLPPMTPAIREPVVRWWCSCGECVRGLFFF